MARAVGVRDLGPLTTREQETVRRTLDFLRSSMQRQLVRSLERHGGNPSPTDTQILEVAEEEAMLLATMAGVDAASKCFESGSYWVARKLPSGDERMTYYGITQISREEGSLWVITPLVVEEHPDYKAALERSNSMRSYGRMHRVSQWNAKPLRERMELVQASQSALVELRAMIRKDTDRSKEAQARMRSLRRQLLPRYLRVDPTTYEARYVRRKRK